VTPTSRTPVTIVPLRPRRDPDEARRNAEAAMAQRLGPSRNSPWGRWLIQASGEDAYDAESGRPPGTSLFRRALRLSRERASRGECTGFHCAQGGECPKCTPEATP
jgi:hypothetical protein